MSRALRFLALAGVLACGTFVPFSAGAQSAAVLKLPAGFTAERIATVAGARELAVAPNGDLFVGTLSNTIAIVADAQGTPAAARTFATFDDRPVASVALSGDALYTGGQFGVYRVSYRTGDRAARERPEKIAAVRTSGQSRDHRTTSVALSRGVLYAAVGSSCNACDPELDATRATVLAMNPDGKNVHVRAAGIRNAIALALDAAGGVWAGVAGRDDLERGHPYEIFDEITAHGGTPDYGWLHCYDDRKPIGAASCANAVVPKVVFPAYATPIGATFYPTDGKGRYAFPPAYRGGAFVTLHGSWHVPPVAPRVAFVPFKGGDPARAVDWNNPDAQWTEFAGGCQLPDGSRPCRPTGVAVGTDGSLFVADDETGAIYRIRPSGR